MPNWKKLKKLINEYERSNQLQQNQFYRELYHIAKIELNLKQLDLKGFFRGG